MTQLSKEYAESLFSLGAEDSNEEKYLNELRYVNEVFSANPEYVELLASPALIKEERTELLDKAFGESLSEFVLSFLKVLCESGHIKLFTECVAEYSRLYRESMRKSAVKVTSASELTEDEKRRIAAKIEKIVDGDCDIMYSVDPSLIGGAIIETENAVIDGSLKKSLQEMKEVIKK